MDQPIPTIAIEPPKTNWVLFSLIGIAILVIGIVAGLLIGKYIYTPKPTQIPLPAETLVKEGDPTVNWKTYINQDFKLSFKYPPIYEPVSEMDSSVSFMEKDVIMFNITTGKLTDYKKLNGCEATRSLLDQLYKYPCLCQGVILGPNNDWEEKKFKSAESFCVDEGKPESHTTEILQIYSTPPIQIRLSQSFRSWDTDEVNDLYDQILSTFKFVDQATPGPTCKPRPACLDATPRCMIPETSDMCPPNQKL